MQTSYAAHYEDLWRRHWWWQARRRLVLRQVRRLASRGALAHILDIGCGNGLFFEDLSHFGSVRGIESDPLLVPESSPWREHITIHPFDASFTPEQPLDLVLMLDVLEHIADDAAAARRVFDLLRPNGYFLVTVPALLGLWSRHDVVNQHFRRYTRSSLAAVIEGAGFKIVKLHYFFGWTLAPMLLRRLLSPAAGHGAYEVRVPAGPVNRGMYALSRAEQMLLPRVPLGSSLLTVAQKIG